jgi:hypothetical protein
MYNKYEGTFSVKCTVIWRWREINLIVRNVDFDTETNHIYLQISCETSVYVRS